MKKIHNILLASAAASMLLTGCVAMLLAKSLRAWRWMTLPEVMKF